MYSILNDKQKQYITNLLADRINPDDIKNKEIREIIKNTSQNTYSPSSIRDITSILQYDFLQSEKKTDGITFTPLSIVEYMYKDVLSFDINYITKLGIADLSVGNGAFFVGLILYLKSIMPNISVSSLIENNLYGYDIKEENVFFTKLNLYLITLYFGENPDQINFQIYHGDTLKYFQENTDIKFDLIVGNPPYVKQQNISLKYRNYLIENFETINSNYNLYYAFIELSIRLLTEDGISLQLVPNYLLKIKSAKSLREYLLAGSYISKIVNFNANKIFDGIDTYSMIIELKSYSNDIRYKSLHNNVTNTLSLINNDWKLLSNSNISNDAINLIDDNDEELVNQVQSQFFTLDISTGIATQKDKLFLIDDSNLIKNKYMKKIYNDKIYLIEKDSVVKIYKGSGQEKGNLKYKHIIYPYYIRDGVARLKSHDYLVKHEPLTYKYLSDAKEDMMKRSGISKEDEYWYRYGRTQSLNRFDTKILFPTNALKPNFNLIEDQALFFNGYAIYGLKQKSLSQNEFRALEYILNSKLIEIFMLKTSYFIGSGYVSYQKKYIEKVTLPILSEEQVNNIIELGQMDNRESLNKLIFEIYGLNYYDYV